MPGRPARPTVRRAARTDREEYIVATVAPDPAQRRGAYGAEAEPGGWVVFAGIMLMIVGSLDALWGLAAILNDQVVTVGGAGVVVWDFTAWGWAHLIWGLLMVGTGLGLFAAMGWARWAGVFFATVSAILQFGVITAFPLWALLIIALDVVIIYQLTVRWRS
jgi:hypothetical protein